jgi:hypothetical protein
MSAFMLELDETFDDYAWETEAKGWFPNAIAIVDQRRYRITFYDSARLAQDIADELKAAEVFFEPNLVVVPSVTRQNMENAIRAIVSAGRHLNMMPEAEHEMPR